MTIGLLVCDAVKTEYKAEFGDYSDMFAALFPEDEMKLYYVYKGEFPDNVEDCEVYMATGSSHSVYEDLDWIHRTKAFIKEIYKANKYFIGFCFGHQLLGEALGGKVEKSSNGWCVGVHQFDVYKAKYWMRPTKLKLNFLMMCQDQVITLPKNAVCLAGNEACPNAIMQIGKRMFSFQGHPEFSKRYDGILMENRLERIGKEKIKKGLESMTMPLDIPIFQLWVKEFLRELEK